MAYVPQQSSLLASSPLNLFQPNPPPAVPSSSDVPSSPTTASFYNNPSPGNIGGSSILRTTTTSRPRLYKSQSSHRNSSARNTTHHSHSQRDGPSSSPSHTAITHPFRSIHEQARLQRSKQAKLQRELSNPSLVPDEPGGWTRDGEWEEFDQYEKERLEFEMMRERKEWKWEMKLKDQQASDALVDPDDEEFEGEEMQEDYEAPLPSSFDPSAARIPSLASSVSSSPHFPPTYSRPPSPNYDMDLQADDDVSMLNSSPQRSGTGYDRTRSIRTFEDTLLATTCPACAQAGTIRGDEVIGAKCQKCEWGIGADILRPLELAFASHGDAVRGHLPLFSYTVFTGTLVFCQACDEQFAA
ncbi:uncharacterized protein JCM6883_004675 [Sporobolomyces salmoneus]|uniref:uncharacterized protein n=1 Tax=Sporobolomyces salmoneus TaxID=183962 RepID=UPI003173ADCB